MLNDNYISAFLVEFPPKHEFYDKTIEISNQIKVHSKGEKPIELLRKARPNEDEKYQKWREERWTPITKTYFQKIKNTLLKIRKAEDWQIKFEKTENKFLQENSLKKFLTKNYPYFDSLENWVFSVAWNTLYEDPNAVIVNYPLPKMDANDDTEMLRPFNEIYESKFVFDYKEGEYATIESKEKSTILDANNKPIKDGRVLIFFDRMQIVKFRQYGKAKDWTFTNLDELTGKPMIIQHNFGYMPVFKMGGNVIKFENGIILYDSLINGCIDFFNEAIMDYSDHQVNKAIHLHPDRWEIADVECRGCEGKGHTLEEVNGKKRKTSCTVCNGRGTVSVKSPFGIKFIKAGLKVSENEALNVPTPPMGYADRPMESLQFLKDEVKTDIMQGLSAVNMEFLMETPVNESGVSKSYDHDGIYTIMANTGRVIVENIIRPTIYFSAMWMYRAQLSEEEIDDALPNVKVPEKYDMVIASLLSEKAVSAKNANLNPLIVGALESNYARKELGDYSEVPKMMDVIAKHDPLYGQSVDEKMTTLANKGCTQEQFVLSSQISNFVTRAFVENDDFDDMDYAEQSKILYGYAKEIKPTQTTPIVNNNGVIS